jgi:hypothetical protein
MFGLLMYWTIYLQGGNVEHRQDFLKSLLLPFGLRTKSPGNSAFWAFPLLALLVAQVSAIFVRAPCDGVHSLTPFHLLFSHRLFTSLQSIA